MPDKLLSFEHSLRDHSRSLPDLAPPVALRDRILERLPEDGDRKRATRRHRNATRGAVAAIMGAMALIFVWFPGRLPQPAVAFADIERAVNSAQSVHWTTYDKRDLIHYPRAPFYRQGRYVRPAGPAESTSDNWIRLKPFAKSTRSQDGFWVGDGRHLAEYEAGTRSYQLFSYKNETSVTSVTQNILAPGSDFLAEYQGKMLSDPHGDPVVYGGKPALRFEGVFDTTPSGLILRPTSHGLVPIGPLTRRLTYLVWADAKTNLIVRTETRETDLTTGRIVESTITDNYCYDVTPPPGVFDMTPPSHAVVKPEIAYR